MVHDSIGDQNTLEERTRRSETTGSLAIGQMFGQYRILEFLGRGGMGEVYGAEHTVLRRPYAIKLIPQDLSSRKGFLERLEKEAMVLANLDHPCIVRVSDFGETGGRHWMRMELAEGIGAGDGRVRTLADLVAVRGGRIEQELLAAVLEQLLDGLSYAHGRGAVHRDLKPANILISGTGVESGSIRVKISDFGLVRLVGEDWVQSRVDKSVLKSASLGEESTIHEGGDEAGTSTRSLLGTYAYMSPEQKRGRQADERSDIYSVGLMAFRLLTGQAEIDFNLPSSIDPGLDPAWDGIVKSACAVNPKLRFASAVDMLESVQGVRKKLGVRERIGTLIEDARRRLGAGDHDGAGRIVAEVLEADPGNPEAEAFRKTIDAFNRELGDLLAAVAECETPGRCGEGLALIASAGEQLRDNGRVRKTRARLEKIRADEEKRQQAEKPIRWVGKGAMRGDCTTCTVKYGSGARTYMDRMPMGNTRETTPDIRLYMRTAVPSGCSVAAAGSTFRGSSGVPIGTGTSPASGTATSASASSGILRFGLFTFLPFGGRGTVTI